MRIEKVNDNQIRCVLTREDLADRQIKLSELAYGSEKAKSLFREMIQQASYEVGFEADDVPLMVEAIPVSSESIILVITKVEYPEELDGRFSRFTESDEDAFSSVSHEKESSNQDVGAMDVLHFFEKVRKEAAKNQAQQEDLVRAFRFPRLEQVERLAHVLKGIYHGDNTLYKDDVKKEYILFVHKNGHTPEEFNKICNIISEYASARKVSSAKGAYYKEHDKIILEKNALQVLSDI